MGAVQSMWLQSRPSSSLASSSLIITSQAPTHAVQFTPSFDFFPRRRTRSLDFLPDWDCVKSLSCPKANIKKAGGKIQSKPFALKGIKDQCIFEKTLNINASEWSIEWRGGFLCDPVLDFSVWLYWTHKGPQRSRMGSDDFPTCGGLLCDALWFWLLSRNVYMYHICNRFSSFQDKQKKPRRLYRRCKLRRQNCASIKIINYAYIHKCKMLKNAKYYSAAFRCAAQDGCVVLVDFVGFFASVFND